MSNNDTNKPTNPSDRILDEILAELMRAVDAGQSVEPDEWLQRYPDFAADLKEYFDKQERMERLIHPLREAAAHALHVRCPHCHNPMELLDHAPLTDISCPSCGSSFSLVGEKTISHYSAGEKTIGHFQLLDRVGMGAFGSVWKAHDTNLDRTVAVKIPRHSQLDESQTELFLRDARSAAQLKHPNIVGVHEVGKQDNTVYIVSDFIQGASLKEWLDTRRLTSRETAELCLKIAMALHHAHESGVIHRDLKPSNIMMDAEGEPHIVDFGLAKREVGEITMTVNGQILGTPAYMSPEQARGEAYSVDRRADIYSIGVILFELLTGELPFRGDKQMLIIQILNDDPPILRTINSNAPRDLETICLKCLEKEPQKRYGTTALLADDLGRYLNKEPILASPIGRIGRIWRWCRREPILSSLTASVVILLFVVAVAGPITAAYQSQLRNKAEDLVDDKNVLLNENVELIADLKSSVAEQTRATQEANWQAELARRKSYNLQLRRVADLWRNNPSAALESLKDEMFCPTQMRDFTWRLFHRLVNLSPRFISVPEDGRSHIALSPKGKIVALVKKESISLWRTDTLQEYANIEGDFTGVWNVEFSPNGLWLALGDAKEIVIWNVASRKIEKRLSGHSTKVSCVGWSRSGGLLASGEMQGETILWQVNNDWKSTVLKGHKHRVYDIDFSSDDSLLAATSHDQTIRLWEVKTGKETAVLREQPYNAFVTRAIFHSEDNKIWQLGGTGLIDWDLETRLSRNTGFWDLDGPADAERIGTTLLAVMLEQFIILWDPELGDTRARYRAPIGVFRSMANSRDATLLAAVAGDRLYLFDLKPKQQSLILDHGDLIDAMAFSKDNQILVTFSNQDQSIKLWNSTTGEPLTNLKGTVNDDVVDVVNPATGQVQTKIRLLRGNWTNWPFPLSNTHQDKSSRRMNLEARISGNDIELWDTIQQKKTATLRGHTDGIIAIAISPDGKTIVSSGWDMTIRVWDPITGDERAVLEGRHTAEVVQLIFSTDGSMLASASVDGTAKVWIANRTSRPPIRK